jgi:hypothetical protein
MRHQGGHFAMTNPIAEAGLTQCAMKPTLIFYHTVLGCRNTKTILTWA